MNHIEVDDSWSQGQIGEIIDEIKSKTSGVDIVNYDYNTTNHPYLKYLMLLINSEFDGICTQLKAILDNQLYSSIQNKNLQKIVVYRLKKNITPNCALNNELKETPIDLRNIVAGTWKFIYDQDYANYVNFYKLNHCANLLSLKAIELSFYQQHFFSECTR